MSTWAHYAGFFSDSLELLAPETFPPVPQRRPQNDFALGARTTAASLLPPFLTPGFAANVGHLPRPCLSQVSLPPAPSPSLPTTHTQGFGFPTSSNLAAGRLGPEPFQTPNPRPQPHTSQREVAIPAVPGTAQAANSRAEEAISSPDLSAISTSAFTTRATTTVAIIPQPSLTRPPPPPLSILPPPSPPPTSTLCPSLPPAHGSSNPFRSIFLTNPISNSDPANNNHANKNNNNTNLPSPDPHPPRRDLLPLGGLLDHLATSHVPSSSSQVHQLRRPTVNEFLLPSAFTPTFQHPFHECGEFPNGSSLNRIQPPHGRCRTTGDPIFHKEEQPRGRDTDRRHAVGSPLRDEPSDTMPAIRKRPLVVDAHEDVAGPSGTKRRRSRSTTAGISARVAKPKSRAEVRNPAAPLILPDSDDVFALDEQETDADKTTTHLYDLTKDDNIPEELLSPLPPKEDNSIRLSKFECIICMDSATNLTVTHCGHMFCAQCLHQAMHSEVTKRICPMCRQKLDLRPRDHNPPRTSKTFFHLELKLMPSKRQGKQPARLRRS